MDSQIKKLAIWLYMYAVLIMCNNQQDLRLLEIWE